METSGGCWESFLVGTHMWACIWRLQVDVGNHSWWIHMCARAYRDFRWMSGVTVLPYSLGHTSQSDLQVDNMASLLAVALRTSNLSAARITGELLLSP